MPRNSEKMSTESTTVAIVAVMMKKKMKEMRTTQGFKILYFKIT
jgi:hypothetical protein